MVEVWFVVLPGTLLLDLAGPAEALRMANQRLQRLGQPPRFHLRFVGPARRPDSSVGLALAAVEPLPARLAGPTWVVLMGQPSERPMLQAPEWFTTRQWLAQVIAPALGSALPTGGDAQAGAGLVTICAGALLAADAGLLRPGQRCTTHHEVVDVLRSLAPAADVVGNRVFVEQGPVASSAGITAGIDLALHLVARECGEATASAIARNMVMYLRRGADDPELSPLLSGRNHLHPALHRVQDAICDKPGAAWSAEAMARVAHVTPRHLGRLFREFVGTSPRAYVEQVRSALAQEALRSGLAVQAASEAAGFSSPRQWRRARTRARGAAA
ncbi:GlxA family transcriptional regulator [Aquincola sp. J276]|uniref:GlxA family transcriptional regulator n=1 Tax=Aquincola sp. J276 TaxID=2898432 RepID=UPI002150A36C|nr:helix-turn-helix domain-containing protein [Aquincola sp. J276]MCR5865590.1 helix-turn-helix domain-containing protein [Aquincola sp. J276]